MSLGPKSRAEAEVFAIEELLADVQYEIEKLMKQNEVSRSELAKKLGCTAANVSHFLSEDSNLRLDTIARIFFHLGAKVVISGQAEDDVDIAQGASSAVEEGAFANIFRAWSERHWSGSAAASKHSSEAVAPETSVEKVIRTLRTTKRYSTVPASNDLSRVSATSSIATILTEAEAA